MDRLQWCKEAKWTGYSGTEGLNGPVIMEKRGRMDELQWNREAKLTCYSGREVKLTCNSETESYQLGQWSEIDIQKDQPSEKQWCLCVQRCVHHATACKSLSSSWQQLFNLCLLLFFLSSIVTHKWFPLVVVMTFIASVLHSCGVNL